MNQINEQFNDRWVRRGEYEKAEREREDAELHSGLLDFWKLIDIDGIPDVPVDDPRFPLAFKYPPVHGIGHRLYPYARNQITRKTAGPGLLFYWSYFSVGCFITYPEHGQEDDIISNVRKVTNKLKTQHTKLVARSEESKANDEHEAGKRVWKLIEAGNADSPRTAKALWEDGVSWRLSQLLGNFKDSRGSDVTVDVDGYVLARFRARLPLPDDVAERIKKLRETTRKLWHEAVRKADLAAVEGDAHEGRRQSKRFKRG